jgi:hypothetical protein
MTDYIGYPDHNSDGAIPDGKIRAVEKLVRLDAGEPVYNRWIEQYFGGQWRKVDCVSLITDEQALELGRRNGTL